MPAPKKKPVARKKAVTKKDESLKKKKKGVYEVIKKFGLYEYNVKTKASKIVWYNVGEEVNETVAMRLASHARPGLLK